MHLFYFADACSEMKKSCCVLIAFGLVMLAIPAAAPAADMQVWVAHDCTKVKMYDPPGSANSIWSPGSNRITLKGGRNEYLAFQLIVRANHPLTNVSASAGDLKGASGVISSSNVSFFREHYLHVTEPSTSMYGDPSSDGAGWYPDALIPFDAPVDGAPFTVPVGSNQGIWVDVYVPRNAAAGKYSGSISVTASGGNAVSIGIDVMVWGFTLPDDSHMKTWFYFGQDELANGHHVAKYDEHYRALEEKYYRMARAHRINIDAPVYFEYKGTGSGVTVDWKNHDDLAGRLYDGTLFDDGLGLDPICLPVNLDFPYCDDHGGLYSEEYARTLTKVLQLVKQHFDERGWTGRAFLWMLDEPNDADAYQTVRRLGQIAHSSGAGIPFMLTEQPTDALSCAVDSRTTGT